jgi:vacuolar-type H+-ATPase subunit I/STV1
MSESLNALIDIVNNEVVMNPVLLNSGDSITIKMLVSQFDNVLDINGRIIGVNSIYKKKENFGSVISFYLGILLVMFSSIVLAREQVAKKPMIEQITNPWFAIYSVGFLLLLIGLTTNRRFSRAINSWIKKDSARVFL